MSMIQIFQPSYNPKKMLQLCPVRFSLNLSVTYSKVFIYEKNYHSVVFSGLLNCFKLILISSSKQVLTLQICLTFQVTTLCLNQFCLVGLGLIGDYEPNVLQSNGFFLILKRSPLSSLVWLSTDKINYESNDKDRSLYFIFYFLVIDYIWTFLHHRFAQTV